jgi:flagellar protein FliO/FliZ
VRWRSGFTLGALAPGLLLCRGAFAAAGEGFQAVSGGKLVETLLGLLLVLALIFVLARVLQRMQGSVSGGNTVMRVVSSLNIGTRERILLLKVADKHILVAATPQTVSPLHVFDEMPADLPEASPQSTGFAGLLQSMSSGENNR